MAKFKVTLKQHTPLIYFHSSQQGEILRASEVKPKLDKFLIKYVFQNNFEEYKHYLIGYKHTKTEDDFKDKKAFDYKLRVTNIVNYKKEYIEYEGGKKTFPNYFGNMGKPKNEYSQFVYCDSLELEIFSLYKDIVEIIKKELPNFLMKHNFGNRQSKGFGSFFINNENKYSINGEEKCYSNDYICNIRQLKYSFIVDFNDYVFKKYIHKKQIKDKSLFYRQMFGVFKEIEDLYIKIRRGKKGVSPYIKKYAEMKNIIWDKDAIKEVYCKIKINSNDKRCLIKDLLGLSSREEWVKSDKIITKEHVLCEKHKSVERYQSPIFFKPINIKNGMYIIYFEGRDVHKEYLNQEFLIKCNGEGNLKLKTPEKFNIYEFLEYVQKNNSNYIRINKVGGEIIE